MTEPARRPRILRNLTLTELILDPHHIPPDGTDCGIIQPGAVAPGEDMIGVPLDDDA